MVLASAHRFPPSSYSDAENLLKKRKEYLDSYFFNAIVEEFVVFLHFSLFVQRVLYAIDR